ncbi:MAG: dipeptidase PepV, partial [Clostridia bacterium]|nr:dipeptidase PepV [Clostridia bacterium]
SVYEECTGQKAEPVSSGGGTYARALKCGGAFGPEMPGDTPVIHQPDEYITVERVELLLDIYEKAIEKLTK